MRTSRARALLTVVALLACGRACGAEVGGDLAEPVSQDALRATWRNLAHEGVMFPLDMGTLPVRIGGQRQLFVDNYLIAKARDVTRLVHAPRRHPDNPLLFYRAEEGRTVPSTIPMQVLQFDDAPRFRMWYWSWRGWHEWPDGRRIRFGTSYAHSEDGVHWVRPDLDLHRIPGSPERNVVLPYGLMQGVFHDVDDPDPERRFKALVCVELKDVASGKLVIPEAFYLHTSPDGIHWRADLERPLLRSLTSYDYPQNGVGDTTTFWWDPLRRRYVGDVKFVLPGKIRSRGVMFSDDLVHWTPARPTFMARDPANEIYGHAGAAWQGMYIGLRWVYVPAFDRDTHSMHVELDCSRDGDIWTRVGAGQPFMALNPQRDTWDASRLKPVALLEVGDEAWIYYGAGPTALDVATGRLPDGHRVSYSLGLATLPRDRFASIHAGDAPGMLLTRPLDFTGRRLHLNAAVGEGGRIRVAVVSARGVVDGYGLDDCTPITGDAIDAAVTWGARSDLESLAGSSVRLRFELQRADLFAFRLE